MKDFNHHFKVYTSIFLSFITFHICVYNFHMHNSSLQGSFLKTKLLHQNLIYDEGGGGLGQFLTLADKGGREGGLGPSIFG